jgi:hypothetical protein
MASLVLNVVDAVEVTRRLGLRYLWVDALCIVQDSDEDKASKIVRMGAIYKNGAVTITAATRRAAREGLLPRQRTVRLAAVRLRLPSGDVGVVRLSDSHLFHAGQGGRSRKDRPSAVKRTRVLPSGVSPVAPAAHFLPSDFNVGRQCQIGRIEFTGGGAFGHQHCVIPPSNLVWEFGGATRRQRLGTMSDAVGARDRSRPVGL